MFLCWCEHEKQLNSKFLKVYFFVESTVHDLQDENLLAKPRAGDMIALEARYISSRHLVSLYNKVGALQIEDSMTNVTSWVMRSIVLAELLAYIDESRMEEDMSSTFKLSN